MRVLHHQGLIPFLQQVGKRTLRSCNRLSNGTASILYPSRVHSVFLRFMRPKINKYGCRRMFSNRLRTRLSVSVISSLISTARGFLFSGSHTSHSTTWTAAPFSTDVFSKLTISLMSWHTIHVYKISLHDFYKNLPVLFAPFHDNWAKG